MPQVNQAAGGDSGFPIPDSGSLTPIPDSGTLTTQEFAGRIKAKYPQYRAIPDDQLTQKILAKYPQYRTQVKMGTAAGQPSGVSPQPSAGSPQASALSLRRPLVSSQPGVSPQPSAVTGQAAPAAVAPPQPSTGAMPPLPPRAAPAAGGTAGSARKRKVKNAPAPDDWAQLMGYHPYVVTAEQTRALAAANEQAVFDQKLKEGKALGLSGESLASYVAGRNIEPADRLERVPVTLTDGTNALANFDPQRGRYSDPATGRDITAKVAGEYKPPAGESPSVQDDLAYEALVKKQAMGQRLTREEQASMKAYEKRKTLASSANANIRIQGYAAARPAPALIDTKAPGGPALANFMSMEDADQATKADPKRYMPAAQYEKLGKQWALADDISGQVKNVNDAIDALDKPFTAGQRILLVGALVNSDASSRVAALVSGEFKGALTEPQQDYVIAVGQLAEQAMAMRAMLQIGQGAEDIRAAITQTIPGPGTPAASYARKQLTSFQRVIDRVMRGVPKVPLPAGGDLPASDGSGIPSVPKPQSVQTRSKLPPQAVKQLKEGVHTTFANGQMWTLKGGQPQQLDRATGQPIQ